MHLVFCPLSPPSSLALLLSPSPVSGCYCWGKQTLPVWSGKGSASASGVTALVSRSVVRSMASRIALVSLALQKGFSLLHWHCVACVRCVAWHSSTFNTRSASPLPRPLCLWDMGVCLGARLYIVQRTFSIPSHENYQVQK